MSLMRVSDGGERHLLRGVNFCKRAKDLLWSRYSSIAISLAWSHLEYFFSGRSLASTIGSTSLRLKVIRGTGNMRTLKCLVLIVVACAAPLAAQDQQPPSQP